MYYVEYTFLEYFTQKGRNIMHTWEIIVQPQGTFEKKKVEVSARTLSEAYEIIRKKYGSSCGIGAAKQIR